MLFILQHMWTMLTLRRSIWYICSFSFEINEFLQVPKAIEVARKKAEENNVNIQFEVVNMVHDLSPTNLKQHSYDVNLDAAVFHAFTNDDRQYYVKNLEYLIKPGGLYIQIQYNLSIVDTQGTFSKCPLYGGVHFREVFDFFSPKSFL
jgi:hypothetical protein